MKKLIEIAKRDEFIAILALVLFVFSESIVNLIMGV